mgnify:CR=1 FL=1
MDTKTCLRDYGKLFLEKLEDYPECKSDIEDGRFRDVYLGLDDLVPRYAITAIFLESDIDFLPGMGDNLYNGLFRYLDGDKVKSITLPPNIEFIRMETFDECEVEELYIKANIIEIEDGAFSSCRKLKKIKFDATPENVNILGINSTQKSMLELMSKGSDTALWALGILDTVASSDLIVEFGSGETITARS